MFHIFVRVVEQSLCVIISFLKSKIEQNAVFGPKYLENGKDWRDQIFYPCRTIARGRKNGEKIFQGQTNKMLKKFKKVKKVVKKTPWRSNLKVKCQGHVVEFDFIGCAIPETMVIDTNVVFISVTNIHLSLFSYQKCHSLVICLVTVVELLINNFTCELWPEVPSTETFWHCVLLILTF